MRLVIVSSGLAAALAGALGAQSIPSAVPAKQEPHHHLVYEDATLRVLRVRVPARDTTLLHEHAADYFWIALGPSRVVNAKLGAPDATIQSADMSIHYTPGRFAHVARNPGSTPFDNITVELLRPQTHVANLCEPALANQPMACRDSSAFDGASEHPAFATDQLSVSLATVPPRGTVRATGARRGVWIIALDTADTRSALVVAGEGRWRGGVYHAQSSNWTLRNTANRPIRVLAVRPKG